MTFFFYTGITVRDLDRSIKFYTEVMGMRMVARVKNPYTNGEFAELVSREEEVPQSGTQLVRRYERLQNGDELDHLGFLSKIHTKNWNVSRS